MKTNYFTLLCLMLTSCLFTQNNDFNNAGGDFIWSNPSNWSLNAVPVPANTVRLPILAESQVNADYAITKIQTVFATANASPGSTVSVAGANNLTINAGSTMPAYAIENVSDHNVNLSFKGNVTINNPSGFSRIRNLNGASNAIEFAAGSVLTLSTGFEIFGTLGSFNFNGTLAGSGNFRLAANTVANFGSTSSNSGYTGEIVFLLNSVINVNTTDNNTFYDGPKIQVNGNNAAIVLNGANVFASNISVGGSTTFTFTANKNQSNMGNIVFSNNGTLNLVIDDSVTNLSFGDNSAIDWATGTLNITGFKEGVIRFGTDNTALTTEQLAQIVADNGGDNLALDNNGFLVNKTTLSLSDFEIGTTNPIIQATVASNLLKFNMPQNNVKIVDLSGRVVFNKLSQNLSEINVDFLSPGNYFAIFDDSIIERFIKK